MPTFYRRARGPYLEAMCGSGRLLIPLLEQGFSIDGVDNSAEMLKSCLNRCKSLNIKVDLFGRSLQELSIPKKYSSDFHRRRLFSAYRRARASLERAEEPCGSISCPAKLISRNVYPLGCDQRGNRKRNFARKRSQFHFEKTVSLSGGFEIVHKGNTTAYLKEQLEVCEEPTKIYNRQVLETEKERPSPSGGTTGTKWSFSCRKAAFQKFAYGMKS